MKKNLLYFISNLIWVKPKPKRFNSSVSASSDYRSQFNQLNINFDTPGILSKYFNQLNQHNLLDR